jgi:transcriptional regulator with XRE-family HTH domain
MNQSTLGEFVQKIRKEKALTQEELAGLTELDIRTIQRIEKGEVKPYFSTLKILSKVLDYDFISEANKPWQFSEEEIGLYREIFKRKRSIRIAIFVIGMSLMLAAAATFPHFRFLGMAKSTWAPFLYVIMFGLIIGIGLVWRCPACNAHLGDPFISKFCPKCGFKFKE